MAAPFTSVTVLNYNLNPPPDDGTQVPANQLQWSKHKTKIGDPLKTAIESINTNLGTAFGKIIGGGGITSTAISYGVSSSDQGKLVVATAPSITITTPDAASVGAPFVFGVLNNSTGDVTLDGSGTQTINGSLSLTMAAGDGWLVFTDGSNWFVIGKKDGSMPRNGRSGCILSNGTDATNDINISLGKWRDSTDTVDIVVATALGKQLDANWTAGGTTGTPLGMRNSAASIANASYHLYLVRTAASSAGDVYAYAGVAGTDADSSAAIATMLTALHAETGGSSYVYARRIGSIVRVSAAIQLFTQHNNEFWLPALVQDYNTANPGTSAVTITLASVPVGIKALALIQGVLVAATSTNIAALFTALHQTDVAPDANNFTLSATSASAVGASVPIRIWTDLSTQIRARINPSGASDRLKALTYGWVDQFGQDA